MRHISRLVFGVVAALAWLGPDALSGEAAPFAYIVNSADSMAVVDTATNGVVATVQVPPGPLSLAVLPDKTIIYKAGDYFFESGDVNHTVYNKTDQPNQHLLFEILPADLKGPSLIPAKKD